MPSSSHKPLRSAHAMRAGYRSHSESPFLRLMHHRQMLKTCHSLELQRAKIMDGYDSLEPAHCERRHEWRLRVEEQETRGIEVSGSDAARTAEIASRVACGLRDEHHAVIDNFLQSADAAAALGRVLHEMHARGELAPGQMAGGQSKSTRGDLMCWVPASAEQPPALRTLLSALDRMLLRLVCEPYVASDLADVSLMRAEAQLTVYPGDGSRYIRHTDDARAKVRKLTCILYAGNPHWREADSGGKLRLHLGEAKPPGTAAAEAAAEAAEGREALTHLLPEWARPTAMVRAGEQHGRSAGRKVAAWTATRRRAEDIAPIDNRLVVFWSDGRVPHEVLPAYEPRYAVSVWYHDLSTRE